MPGLLLAPSRPCLCAYGIFNTDITAALSSAHGLKVKGIVPVTESGKVERRVCRIKETTRVPIFLSGVPDFVLSGIAVAPSIGE